MIALMIHSFMEMSSVAAAIFNMSEEIAFVAHGLRGERGHNWGRHDPGADKRGILIKVTDKILQEVTQEKEKA